MVAKMGERMGGDRAFLFGRRTYEDLLASWNAQGGRRASLPLSVVAVAAGAVGLVRLIGNAAAPR
jgi:hypothetical protein